MRGEAQRGLVELQRHRLGARDPAFELPLLTDLQGLVEDVSLHDR